MRNQLRRQEWEVSGPGRNCIAEIVGQCGKAACLLTTVLANPGDSLLLADRFSTTLRGGRMANINGHKNGRDTESMPVVLFARSKKNTLSQQQLLALMEKLKVPFDPASLQWKVVETKKAFGRLRGRVIPYADLREYYKRLNELMTPIGWAQTFTVTTTPIASRDRSAASAKVIAVCQLTIHALGTH